MTCYARPLIAVLAVVLGSAAAFLHVTVAGPAVLVLAGAAFAVLILLGWIALIVSRNRAEDGACTSCRLRCQQPAVRPEPEPVQLSWPHIRERS